MQVNTPTLYYDRCGIPRLKIYQRDKTVMLNKASKAHSPFKASFHCVMQDPQYCTTPVLRPVFARGLKVSLIIIIKFLYYTHFIVCCQNSL